MTKPQEFKEQRIIRSETPYQVDEQFAKGPQAGIGVLTPGRVVWTRQGQNLAENEATVSAFAEGVGVVSVEARSLRV